MISHGTLYTLLLGILQYRGLILLILFLPLQDPKSYSIEANYVFLCFVFYALFIGSHGCIDFPALLFPKDYLPAYVSTTRMFLSIRYGIPECLVGVATVCIFLLWMEFEHFPSPVPCIITGCVYMPATLGVELYARSKLKTVENFWEKCNQIGKLGGFLNTFFFVGTQEIFRLPEIL